MVQHVRIGQAQLCLFALTMPMHQGVVFGVFVEIFFHRKDSVEGMDEGAVADASAMARLEPGRRRIQSVARRPVAIEGLGPEYFAVFEAWLSPDVEIGRNGHAGPLRHIRHVARVPAAAEVVGEQAIYAIKQPAWPSAGNVQHACGCVGREPVRLRGQGGVELQHDGRRMGSRAVRDRELRPADPVQMIRQFRGRPSLGVGRVFGHHDRTGRARRAREHEFRRVNTGRARQQGRQDGDRFHGASTARLMKSSTTLRAPGDLKKASV